MGVVELEVCHTPQVRDRVRTKTTKAVGIPAEEASRK